MISRHLLAGVALASLSLGGCAMPQLNYEAKAPTPSGLKYIVTGTPVSKVFSLVDERRADGKIFHTGILPGDVKIDGAPIDPVPFLATQLQAELVSRGLPAQVSDKSTDPPAIHLKTYRMQNMRTNAYTPFITLTYISADVGTGDGAPRRIATFVTRGKTPMWRVDEPAVVEPIFTQPLALGVQEFASKIANVAYGYRASDETVKSLIAKINGERTPNTFLDVYALGFTNNPAAIDTLAALTRDPQEYVRQAAISSLGNIGATGHLGLLKSIYQDPQVSWQDHSVALKAIADLGTDESKAFIVEEAKRLGSSTAKEAPVLGQILALYL
jgi:hypothetical protein